MKKSKNSQLVTNRLKTSSRAIKENVNRYRNQKSEDPQMSIEDYFTKNDMCDAIGMKKNVFNAMLSKPQNQEIVQIIRGDDDCNLRKAKGRAGYIYTKPKTEPEAAAVPEEAVIYEQQTLDFSSVM